MAKYETRLKGNFDELLHQLNHDILKGSISASYEKMAAITAAAVYTALYGYRR